ncbi:MAG: hypothetical protein QOJ42_977, partial [Acidobacteriaceae bacterium]|nr:hypothetical protein [Acidobacteriaceae bacterium]
GFKEIVAGYDVDWSRARKIPQSYLLLIPQEIPGSLFP